MRLNSKVAAVAAAGGGMGSAVPMLFAQEGAKVVLAARRSGPLEELAQRIRSQGGEAVWVSADLATADGVQAMVAKAQESFGKLDIMYNNMGDSAAGQVRLADTDEETWDYLTNINLKSAYLCARYAIPAMQKNGGGVIINVSASFNVRQRGNSGYGAAKAGIIGLTQNLARAYHPDNIRVHCICPSVIRGNVEAAAIQPAAPRLDRPGGPQDVAYAALYLASDEAAWLTGIVLPVDGGAEIAFGAW